jgi:hypothetical protein
VRLLKQAFLALSGWVIPRYQVQLFIALDNCLLSRYETKRNANLASESDLDARTHFVCVIGPFSFYLVSCRDYY